MTPICSKCRRTISDADVNVATDVAFCRACNIAHKLSSLVHGVTLGEVVLDRTPQGAWRRQSGMGWEIGATHRSIPAALITLGMALFWNGIVSIFVALALSSTLQHLNLPQPGWFPDPKMNGGAIGVGMTVFLWLFLTPFIAIGVMLLAAFLLSLGGRTQVTIGQNEAVLFTGVGTIGRRKRFNVGTVKDVRMENQKWRDSDGDRRSNETIVIEMEDGKILKFGSMLKEERRKFVAAAVLHALLSIRGR